MAAVCARAVRCILDASALIKKGTTMTNRLASAIAYASTCHILQLDKGGAPYILHPLRVMFALKNESEDVQIVGVLHDVVEDCGIKIETIEKMYGKEIADAVWSVSRIEIPVKETYKDFCARSKANAIGCKVKIADLLDNMSPERLSVLPIEEQGILQRYIKALAFMRE